MEDTCKKFQNFQVERQTKLRKLDGLIQEVNSNILQNVNPIIEDLSKDMGITVVLEKSSVVLSADNMDITDDVIKKLNKVLPQVKVSLD